MKNVPKLGVKVIEPEFGLFGRRLPRPVQRSPRRRAPRATDVLKLPGGPKVITQDQLLEIIIRENRIHNALADYGYSAEVEDAVGQLRLLLCQIRTAVNRGATVEPGEHRVRFIYDPVAREVVLRVT